MRLALALVLLATAHPAQSHCYSVWHYKVPQRCGTTIAYAQPRPLRPHDNRPVQPPPDRPRDVVDIPLPDLTAEWATDDRSDGLQRQKALRQLEEESQ